MTRASKTGPVDRDPQALVAEIEALRQRLAESEEALRAIRSGEVDALVVEGPDGPRIFTLESAEAASNRFRGDALAQVGDAVVMVDLDQRITFLNPAAERQYGVRASDVLGCPAEALCHPRWLEPGAEAAAARSLRERGEWRGEWRGELVHLTHDGRELHVALSVSALRDAAGAARGQLAVIRDVTARRQLESRQRAHAAQLELAIQAAHAGLWDWDLERRTIEWSADNFALYGVPATADLQVPADSGFNVHPEDRPGLNRRVVETLAGQWPDFRGEFRVLHPQRGMRWLFAIGRVERAENGKARRMIGMSLDITERKRTEEALAAREETLRELDMRKNVFLATLAHELRNPLAPIRMAAGILQSPGLTPSTLDASRAIISRQVNHMARLLDDLLDVSRIRYGKLEIRKHPVALQEILEAALETTRPLIYNKRQALCVKPLAQPIELEVDPVRLTQVVANLLANAAKYTGEHGEIALDMRLDASDLVIIVRDNGSGIAPAMLPTIFEMFSQVPTTPYRTEGGLGIGLALVKGIVELHGGQVEASSEGLGRGSEFRVRLPRSIVHVKTMEKTPGPAAADISRAPSRRVLIADDNRDAAESLAMLLELSGHEVHRAYSGAEALALGAREQPDIFVLDIGMPDMNGYEVAERIRREPWGAGAWLIAMTGWGDDRAKAQARASGFDHHFTKPVDPMELEELLSRQQPREASRLASSGSGTLRDRAR